MKTIEMEKKFRLTEEFIEIESGKKLYRIECTIPFRDVKKGELGGWIEKAENLSGDAWVYCDAWVYGNAKVYDKAQ